MRGCPLMFTAMFLFCCGESFSFQFYAEPGPHSVVSKADSSPPTITWLRFTGGEESDLETSNFGPGGKGLGVKDNKNRSVSKERGRSGNREDRSGVILVSVLDISIVSKTSGRTFF